MLRKIIAILITTELISSVASYNVSIILLTPEKKSLAHEIFEVVLKDLAIEEVLNVYLIRGIVPKYTMDTLCGALSSSLAQNKSPMIFDTTKSGIASQVVKYFTAAMAIPTVSTSFGQEGHIKAWMSLNKDEEQYLIQIDPPGDTMTEVIKALTKFQNFTSFAVIHDNNFDISHKLRNFSETLQIRILVLKIEYLDIANQLETIIKKGYSILFILGSMETISYVLKEAHEQRVVDLFWYSVQTEDGRVECKCELSLVTVKPLPDLSARGRLADLITKVPTLDHAHAAFFYDVFTRAILASKKLMVEGKWPAPSHFVDCDHYSGKVQSHKQLNLRGAMQDVLKPWTFAPIELNKNGFNSMKFSGVLEAISFATKNDAKYEYLGTWNTRTDSKIQSANLFRNFDGPAAYRVATNVQPPFVMINEDISKGPRLYGLCIDILDILKKRLGFNYYIYVVSDEKMGFINDNGEWNGIVKELIDKRADIGMASISIMPERERVIDFTIPYYDVVGISILMVKPPTPTSIFKFMAVLERDVWLCILGAYFITSTLMWIFDRYSPYSYRNNIEKYKDDDEKRIFTLKECLWFCMTSLTPQGGGEAPKNLSGRCVAATWWLFGFIIMASYTANLAAFLTVARLETPIENFDDLVSQLRVRYAPIQDTLEMRYFERMAYIEDRFYNIWKAISLNGSLTPYERTKLAVWDYPISDKFTKIWEAIKYTKLPQNMAEALQRIRKSSTTDDEFALLGDETDNLYQYHTNCDLQVVGEGFSRKPYGIALQKDSPLRTMFNEALQEMINEGTLIKLKEKWWNNISRRSECRDVNEEIEGISIHNIGGVFIVILMGISGALIALTLEYLWHNHQIQKNSIKPTVSFKDETDDQQRYWGNQHSNQQEHQGAPISNRYLDPLELSGDQLLRRYNTQKRNE